MNKNILEWILSNGFKPLCGVWISTKYDKNSHGNIKTYTSNELISMYDNELQNKIVAFLKEQFYEDWMNENDWNEFLEDLEKQSGVSVKKIVYDFKIGMLNGYAIESQFMILSDLLKTI